MDVGKLDIAGLEPVSALIQLYRVNFAQDLAQLRDRIIGQMGIGDMALRAVNGDPHIDRSAPPDLHHIAQPVNRSGFTDKAKVRRNAALFHQLHDRNRAKAGGAFLVAGNQKGDRALQGPALADDAMARRVDAVIDRWVAKERIVGTVAMIARDGEIVYRRAAGFADREAAIPVAEDTIFRHASMTKAIVSATALALIEEGKLALDDTVENWLPWFTPRLEDGRQPAITIRQLMTHTSGLSYVFLEPAGNPYQTEGVPQGLDDTGAMTLEESLRKLAAVPLVFDPGTQWRYSLSTDVLGAVIEKAAGLRLQEAVARYVSGPLDMTDTSFLVADPTRLAAAYRDGEDKAIRMDDGLDLVPLGDGVPTSPRRALDPQAYPSGGGGMSGTALDYLRFLEAIRTGKGVSLFAVDGEAAGLTRTALLPTWIDRSAVPEVLTAQDPRFTEVVDYLQRISDAAGLNAHLTVEGDEDTTYAEVRTTLVWDDRRTGRPLGDEGGYGGSLESPPRPEDEDRVEDQVDHVGEQGDPERRPGVLQAPEGAVPGGDDEHGRCRQGYGSRPSRLHGHVGHRHQRHGFAERFRKDRTLYAPAFRHKNGAGVRALYSEEGHATS